MGFFEWIREGVRRAVLMGFSDAVAQLGNRSETEDLGPQLAETLQQGVAWEHAKAAFPSATAVSGRKRLGKSLEELRNPSKPA